MNGKPSTSRVFVVASFFVVLLFLIHHTSTVSKIASNDALLSPNSEGNRLVAADDVDDDDDGVQERRRPRPPRSSKAQQFKTYQCDPFNKPGSLPDFLVIGVHKGGSTALYAYLATHPQVVPATCKETHFFSNPSLYKRGQSYYRRLFRKIKNDQVGTASRSTRVVTGEGTPDYIRLPIVPERVKKTLTNRLAANRLRFIVSLRNPTDRFVSHFVGRRDRRLTSMSCTEYVDMSFGRLEKECGVDVRTVQRDYDLWSLRRCFTRLNENPLSRSVYVFQLERWLEFFEPQLFYVVQSENLFKKTLEQMNSIVRWLGVEGYDDGVEERWTASAKRMQGSHHTAEPIAKSCDALRPELDSFFSGFNALLFDSLSKNFDVDVGEEWVQSWSGM